MIKNIVVSESYKLQFSDQTHTKNPYDRLLVKKQTKDEIRANNEEIFNREMNKMFTKIKGKTNE